MKKTPAEIKETVAEIHRLRALLAGRRDEYQIFGRTTDDAQKDVELMDKIRHLEDELRSGGRVIEY